MPKTLTMQQARLVAQVLYGRDLADGGAVIGLVQRGRASYRVGYTDTSKCRSVTTATSAAGWESAFILAAGEDLDALRATFAAIEAVQHPERGVECPECLAAPGEVLEELVAIADGVRAQRTRNRRT